MVACAAVTLLGLLVAGPGAAPREGHLVLLGGGPTPADVFTRTLMLSGGRAAVVAVLPQTYPNDSIGDAAVDLWRTTGAREAFKLRLDDTAGASRALDRATLIWIPGGFQGLFMRTLAGTPIPDAIRRRFAEGATIGGASAGAAAMSLTMLADEVAVDGANGPPPRTMAGLGLWPAAVVSPHFTERRRLGPLVAVLADHPDLVGVGIDEGTALFLTRDRVEVAGSGTVTFLGPGDVPAQTMRAGRRLALSVEGFPRR
jgi:cyanophycinase